MARKTEKGKEGYMPRIDYISVLEKVYFKENNYGEYERKN